MPIKKARVQLRSDYLEGMPLVMKQNEPSNPAHVVLRGPNAEVVEPDAITHLIQGTMLSLHVRSPSVVIA
ncbi:MAG: hypothetical protein L0H63_08505 [Nitrococcus sp.]|nr:hypothetical protein [Nitrococcus sp.]